MPLLYRLRPKDLRTLVIESDRLRLRAISDQYTGEIYRHFTADITRYMLPAPASDISQTQAFVASALLGLERGDDLHFVICRRANDEFIGVCGLHGEGAAAEPELGIWLKKAAHGNRHGCEAIAALRTWAREHVEFERLIYPVDRRNIPSRKIAERLGGAIIAEKKVMSMSGLELDEVVYGIPPEGQSPGPASGSRSAAEQVASTPFVPPSLPVGDYLLRPFRRADATAWYAYLADPRVTQHTSWPAITPDGIAALVERVIEDYPGRVSLRWALVRRGDDELLGSCGFIRWSDQDGIAELAYDLKSRELGPGAHECGRAGCRGLGVQYGIAPACGGPGNDHQREVHCVAGADGIPARGAIAQIPDCAWRAEGLLPLPIASRWLASSAMRESLRILIAEYSPEWPVMFAAERARLLAILTGETCLVEHIGSTAVPGLAAKPVIDLMVGAESLAAIERHVQALADHGYVYIPENEKVLPERRYFEKLEGGVHVAHLHGVVSGTPFWVQHLAFRDALRADPQLVARYGVLKRRLATEHAGDRPIRQPRRRSFAPCSPGLGLNDTYGTARTKCVARCGQHAKSGLAPLGIMLRMEPFQGVSCQLQKRPSRSRMDSRWKSTLPRLITRPQASRRTHTSLKEGTPMFPSIRILTASLAAPLLLGAVQPAVAAYVFPTGADAQAQAIVNINSTVAPSPATQSSSLNLGATAGTSLSGATGSANASIDLGAGELKAYASTTAGFTSQAVAWEFVTFDGNDDVDFAYDIDGNLSNTRFAGMTYVEAAVRVYDVTSWTSYFATTGGVQFAAENGSGSPFPFMEASGFATQAVRGSGSGGCTIYVIANCTVNSAGTLVPVSLNIGGTLSAQAGQLYLLELILTTATYNQSGGLFTQTGDFANTATFSFINLNGLNFESSSGEFLAGPVVPVPAAVWLFGSALGLMGVMRRKSS